MRKSYEDFYNLYSLQKTLRFELLPIGKTQEMLEEDQVFLKDKERKEKYEQTKDYIDKLHRYFAKRTLSNTELKNLEKYFTIFKKYNTDPQNKEKREELYKMEDLLRKEVSQSFDEEAKKLVSEFPNIKFNNQSIDVLFKEKMLDLLKELYGNDENTIIKDRLTGEEISIFDNWKGFYCYFNKFNENRKHLYDKKGKAGSHPTRIIDQNLKRFCKNLETFKKVSLKIDFSEVEKNFSIDINKIFKPDYYNNCLTQEDIDFYNKIIGGETLEKGEKLKGINELINQYRQQNKGEKLPFLNTLDKQILSEKDAFIVSIQDNEEFFNRLEEHFYKSQEKAEMFKRLLRDFCKNQNNYKLNYIYISKPALNTILHSWIQDSLIFEEELYKEMKKDKIQGVNYEKEQGKYNFPEFISLQYIKNSLNHFNGSDFFWKSKFEKEVVDKKIDLWGQFLQIFKSAYLNIFDSHDFKTARNNVYLLIKNRPDNVGQKHRQEVKNYLDYTLNLYQIAKYFAVEKKRRWLDEYNLDVFYTNPNIGYKTNFYEDAYKIFVKYYNDFRNYLTKKPWEDIEKWKLNFENSSLAAGWDKNKENDNTTVILNKDGKYYLAIMKKENTKIFDEEKVPETNNAKNNYQKVVYKYMPDAYKSIPKCSTQTNAVLKHFQSNNTDFIFTEAKNFESPLTICKRDFELNNLCHDKEDISKTFWAKQDKQKAGIKRFQKEYLEKSQNEQEYKKALKDWIDFCKRFIKAYKSTASYDYSKLKKTEDYVSLDEFYRDVDAITYKISFKTIPEEYIEEKNQNNELYLFQIYNKDFSEYSTGKENIHTIYFKHLFSEENRTKNYTLKLDGNAEIFYRPKGLEKESRSLKNSNKKIISKKRYTEDKIFFHCPITLNRTPDLTNSKFFNQEIHKFLAESNDVNIIGVDRGEKHLAYYSVINPDGKVLESDTLNVIEGKDYKTILDEIEKKRQEERKSWDTIEQIKDIKRGYISQVIRKITNLAIQYNAIIVLEDLNMRFKQVRGGIEKSVYQQLEKALIEKLNFVIDKTENKTDKTGHSLKAYQLTAPIDSFESMGKQTGIIFYTQASYTSQIDPYTGWRPNLYLKYTNAKKAKEDISQFTNIIHNKDKNRFEFTYNLKNFYKTKETRDKETWTICSNVQRFRWIRGKNNIGEYKEFKGGEITEKLQELFTSYNIDTGSKDILDQIKKLETKGNEKFFKSLIFFLNLICQIRNTDEKAENENKQDFILSPVEPFFDSRKAREFGENYPCNGDENGAYNIARKGIIILDKLNNRYKIQKDPKVKWQDLNISQAEWDNFAQKK